MRITILAIGSRGDVQPYIALGLGLQKRGHAVRIGAGSNFESFVRGYGLEFMPVGGDFRELMDSDATRRVLEKSNLFHYIADMTAALGQAFQRFAYDAASACEGADAIIFSLLAVSGYSIAEKMRVPSFMALLQPMTRTREFPSIFITTRSFAPLNGLSHAIEDQTIWQPFRQFVNRWRRETLGLKPFPLSGPFKQVEKTRLPILYGFSPTVLPKPADWHEWVHVTGYWFLDHTAGWQPPAALVDFIKAGPPPVYIGFGSMSNRQPEEITRLVLSALAISKQRGVIAIGWGGLGDADLGDSVFKIDAMPHDWLFPQMSAVVHHGGAGTTAAGLRAGVPSIITPFTVDQPFWAERVYALGAGVKPIPRRQLTAERLADAITRAVNDRDLRTRASVIGECIRAEDGVSRAVEAFEKHMAEYAVHTHSAM